MFISKNLTYLRKEKEVSYRKLASLSCVDHSVIHYLENGRIKDPSITTVSKLAKALNISIDDFVYKDLEKEKYQ